PDATRVVSSRGCGTSCPRTPGAWMRPRRPTASPKRSRQSGVKGRGSEDRYQLLSGIRRLGRGRDVARHRAGEARTRAALHHIRTTVPTVALRRTDLLPRGRGPAVRAVRAPAVQPRPERGDPERGGDARA